MEQNVMSTDTTSEVTIQIQDQAEEELSQALKEIDDALHHRSEISPKDNGIKQIVEKCNEIFSDIRVYLERQYETSIDVLKTELEKVQDDKSKYGLLLELGEISPDEFDFGPDIERNTQYQRKIGFIFPDFDTKLNLAALFPLVPDKKTTALLPYLLTCFYLNSSQKKSHEKSKTISTENPVICVNNTIKNLLSSGKKLSGNDSNLIKQFWPLFALKNFLPRIYGYTPRKIHKRNGISIKNFFELREYISSFNPNWISKGFGKRHTKKHDYQHAMLYYVLIYMAFIYSIIASACEDVLGTKAKVDYIESFELFEKHTYAFSTASHELKRSYTQLNLSKERYSSDEIEPYLGSERNMQRSEAEDMKANFLQYMEWCDLPALQKRASKSSFDELELYQIYCHFLQIYFHPVLYYVFQNELLIWSIFDEEKDRVAYLSIQKRNRKSQTTKNKSIVISTEG